MGCLEHSGRLVYDAARSGVLAGGAWTDKNLLKHDEKGITCGTQVSSIVLMMKI